MFEFRKSENNDDDDVVGATAVVVAAPAAVVVVVVPFPTTEGVGEGDEGPLGVGETELLFELKKLQRVSVNIGLCFSFMMVKHFIVLDFNSMKSATEESEEI